MTPSTLYLGKYGIIVYKGHAGLVISTVGFRAQGLGYKVQGLHGLCGRIGGYRDTGYGSA